MRFRGFEFEDQSWFPDVIRNYMTDYLRFLFHTFKLYQPVLPILREALIKTNNYQILDLCSGSGGAMEGVYDNLKHTLRMDVKITLTDLFPSTLIYKHLSQNTNGAISYVARPVDATSVPCELLGFRTLFSGFHHFDPGKATAVIKNAIESQRAIGIFDGGNRNGWMILAILVLHPILIFLCTPLIRPFRVSRLLFTYVIPVIPLCTVWDGIVSVLRLYKPKEMLKMAMEADIAYSYTWNSGMVKNKYGMGIAYLVGYPVNKNQ
ncbi:MAG: class I SAM-dependent methyltransferase [Verrucomicrobia bacterium]|nr:class I SAM-dependent methyltransferase [Prolixibacteraceae bacterium]